jgi:uncharacterized membrane protein YjgN (DUF898 family)
MDEVSKAPAEQPVPEAPAREIVLRFRGEGAEYFRIWIVNVLLTIVTLGIFSAWAKVRRLRYFYGSTQLDGSAFEYHGRPVAILKGRLIALAAYLVFIGAGFVSPLAQLAMFVLLLLGIPWVIVRARLFQSRMSSWRGIRFDFTGTYVGALVAYIGWMLLGFVSLLALWPMGVWKQARFQVNHTHFGGTAFRHEGRLGPFYNFCFGAIGLGLLLAIAGGIAVGVLALAAGPVAQPTTPEDIVRAMFSLRTLVLLLIYAAVFVVVGAYMRARAYNNTVGVAKLGKHELFTRLSAGELIVIQAINLLGMVCTLGLFYPWARIRVLRYQLERTGVRVHGDLESFVGEAQAGARAAGQELGEFLDIDFGF